ncbi:Hot13p PWA37_003859 [Arxiozyma heterogenica]|uniref:CHY-type domain-containing protein n=1 Tax=Arxiozyma heterogenica TaxID=278026 RepID=A0AAN7VYQ2_9SACH|nr:hypothetical protein RI543_004848 [Kazachstania heterogenica]
MAEVRGKLVDAETRCEHWNGANDIIALKLKCCPNYYYPCVQCHNELTSHSVQKFDVGANPDLKCILCGHCGKELTFKQYLSFSTPLSCQYCKHPFNEKCELHYHYYFENIPSIGSD